MHSLDYAILGFYLLAMLLVGVYFRRQQRTSRDYFLGGRSLGWFAVGLSLMATLTSGQIYAEQPAEAYYAGWKLLLIPLAAWACLPIVVAWIVPLYHRLGIYSVYEYLELRFDLRLRQVASGAYVIWRLVWLAGVIYAPCKVLAITGGWGLSPFWLIIVLGVTATLYAYLGGIKAVVWTDVIQAFVMLGGVVVVIAAAWLSIDGGPDRVRDVAASLGRTAFVGRAFTWTEPWSVWSAAPYWFLAFLFLCVADQIAVQRFVTAKDVNEARRSLALNCVFLTLMSAALTYAGVALLAFYQDHPQAMRPNWVVNVDNTTRQSLTNPATRNAPLLDPTTGRTRIDLRTGEPLKDPTSGQPLIDWNEPITPETVDRLVSERRLLRPNTKEPFESADELLTVDPDTGQAQVDIARLGMRSPPRGTLEIGEMILNRRAQEELLPYFLAKQLPLGAIGLVVAALLAACMSTLDSGINSIAALLIADYHRRLGWGRGWLARRAGKPSEQLTEADELRLARLLTLAIGAAATGFAVGMAQLPNVLDALLLVMNAIAGPLLAVFLLGIFTRLATSRGALAAWIVGVLFTVELTAANQYDALSFLWPFQQKLAYTWPPIFGVLVTWIAGCVFSVIWGRRKTREELRGLTLGYGRLGVRHQETPKLQLPIADDLSAIPNPRPRRG